jgi:hypothetical protein
VTTITVTPPTVPTQPPTPREQSYGDDYRTAANAGTTLELAGQEAFETPMIVVNTEFDPSCLDPAIETATSGKGTDPAPAGRLDEIVYLLEGIAAKNNSYRKR